jgi:plastocyanin
MSGIPTVKLGTDLRFTNTEGAGIYHTITSCRFPCLGQTGAAFPLADGRTSAGRELDIDSSELGFGVPSISAPKQRLDWSMPVTKEAGFEPGETVTYFCRVHPFMRGAFEVSK